MGFFYLLNSLFPYKNVSFIGTDKRHHMTNIAAAGWDQLHIVFRHYNTREKDIYRQTIS